MPDITIGVNRDLRGGLDSDTDIQNLAGGNYPDCVNVERNNSGIGGSDAPSDGNAIAYTLTELQKQSQKVRVFNNLIDFQNNEYNYIRMSLFNGNGFLIRNTYIKNTDYEINTFIGIRNAVESVLASPIWNIGLSQGSITGGSLFGADPDYPEGYFDVLFPFEYDTYTFELVAGFGDLGNLRIRPFSVSLRPGNYTGLTLGDAVSSGLIVLDTVDTGTPVNAENIEFTPIQIRIIKEAYSESAVGKPHLIGSKENNSKLFMCWTTKTKDRSEIVTGNLQMYVNAGLESGGGLNKLWVIVPIGHGLVDYQSVIMANMPSPFNIYNGTWVIRVIDENTFYLATSNIAIGPDLPNVPTQTTAEIFTNVDGVGLFVVQSYDVQSNTYTYEIPLKSKQLNWDTKHQIDLDVEFFNNVYSLYYNDFLNRPRVTYFNEPIGTDSAIQAINPTGQYEYEELNEQIKLQQDYAGIEISINNQYQSGGALLAGTYRYGVVLVTEAFSETEISDLTDIVNVYEPIYEGQFGGNVFGNYSTQSTSKINELLVTNIVPGLFKFIDLVSVFISGQGTALSSIQAQVVSRTQLGPNQTSIILNHSGTEIDIRAFSVQALNPIRQTILKAYNNVIGENRLLLSNFETTQQFDISSWTKTFQYSLTRTPVYWDFRDENTLGFSVPYSGYKIDNVNPYICPTGYQLYDWYRFYVVAEFIEGGFSDATFCFDVRFVSQQDYLDSFDTDDDFRFLSTNETNRRNLDEDELVDYNYNPEFDLPGFGDGTRERTYYQFGIKFKNIDWDFSINGVKVRNIIKRLKVCRAERIPEVMNSGALNLATKQRNIGDLGTDPCVYVDYVCSVKNITLPSNNPENNTPVPYSLQVQPSVAGSDERISNGRKYGSYYSPDIIFGTDQFSFIQGDKMIVLSKMLLFNTYFTTAQTEFSYLRKFECRTSPPKAYVAEIEESGLCEMDTEIEFSEGIKYSKKNLTAPVYWFQNSTGFVFSTGEIRGVEQGSPVFKFKDNIGQPFPVVWDWGFGTDYGVYSTVYFRRQVNKYGDTNDFNNILYTNYSISNGESDKVVFGGDVFTQQTWLKKYYPHIQDNTVVFDYGAAGFNIISQNKVNTQLRVVSLPPISTRPVYPITTTDLNVWLNAFGSITMDNKMPTETDQIAQNSAYKVNKDQQLIPTFDSNNINVTKFPSRIIYSELKPNGSTKDFYRVFPPAQFRDNPNNFGAIVHMDLKQGELFTLQELCYTREFLNATGQLSTIDSGQVIIGDSSVLSRPGVRLTSLGSKHKWSYARGLTDAGTDVRCWVNSDFFVVLRAGRDGTVNLTERSMMDTFLRDNMRFVRDKFTPADGQGIHAIWDDVGKNFVITVRGWKDNEPWSGNALGYNIGDVVSYGEQYSIPILYVCIQSLAPPTQQGGGRPDPNPLVSEAIPGSEIGSAYWRKIEFSDTNYYSLFTLCFNEARNRFTHFNTFYPKIYANHFDRFFSPKPHTDESNKFYLMRQGEALVFYDEEHEGYTEYVINQEPSMLKKFVSIAYNAILRPLRVEFKTQFISEQGIEERVTTLDRSEFKIRENIVYSTIKNTLDENGQNNQRTAPMKGMWLRIKTFFKARENQKINDIFVPIRMGQRNVKNP